MQTSDNFRVIYYFQDDYLSYRAKNFRRILIGTGMAKEEYYHLKSSKPKIPKYHMNPLSAFNGGLITNWHNLYWRYFFNNLPYGCFWLTPPVPF